MRRHILALLVLAMPAICRAAVPALVGKTDLEAPVIAIRITPDGKRAVASLQSAGDRPGGLRVIDTVRPEKPVLRGFLANAPGRPVLAPDGRQALLLAQLEQGKFNTATRHQIIAVDLSHPDAPKELWRREIQARKVVLAEDASAYAASQPSAAKEGRWQTVITSVTGGRPGMVVQPLSDAALRQ